MYIYIYIYIYMYVLYMYYIYMYYIYIYTHIFMYLYRAQVDPGTDGSQGQPGRREQRAGQGQPVPGDVKAWLE